MIVKKNINNPILLGGFNSSPIHKISLSLLYPLVQKTKQETTLRTSAPIQGDKMPKKQFLKEISVLSKRHSQYTEKESYFTDYPFNDIATGTVKRSFAYVRVLEKIGVPDHTHTTVVAYEGTGFYAWCSDSFLSGSMDKVKAIKNVTLIAKNKSQHTLLNGLYGKHSSEKPCKFWAGKKCSHYADTLAHIEANQEILDKLIEGFEGKGATSTRKNTQTLMKKYAFKKHVLLEGDKGSGKTYLAHEFVDTNKWEKIFIAGHAGMESIDLLGHLVQTVESVENKGQGNLFLPNSIQHPIMRWKDGPVSEAFRKARAGKKVVLIYDEFLRTPGRELNALVGALAPYGGFYHLRTGKSIGVGSEGEVLEETILAPVENLWVIATTNIGAAYQVDEIDLALEDRFRKIRKDSSANEIAEVLQKAALMRRYSADEVVKNLIKLFETIESFRRDGKLNKPCNLRHLIEAVEFSDNEADIKETLWETRHAWVEVDIDGQPVQEQIDLVESTINQIYK